MFFTKGLMLRNIRTSVENIRTFVTGLSGQVRKGSFFLRPVCPKIIMSEQNYEVMRTLKVVEHFEFLVYKT